MTKPQILKGIAYSAYTLWCPQHGLRSASWSIDPPQPGESKSLLFKNTWDRQMQEVTFPTHIDCDTITFVLTLREGTFNQLRDLFREESKLQKELEHAK